MTSTTQTSTYPRYARYKDSGVEWLGEIPEGWELQKLGSLFDERRVKVSDQDFPPLSVTKKGIVPQLESAAKTNDNDNRKLVKKGDFVINSRSDRKGSSGLAKEDGSVSLINIVLKPREIHAQFSEYLLKSYGFIEEFYRHGHGIVADLWTTRFAEMKSIYVPYPDLTTQMKIARFLDQKTAAIDIAIAKKQRLIELLKEQKAILINRAVTRGLNPDVPMKDSGVEWIGEIPAHWEFTALKNCCSVIKDGLHQTPTKHDSGIHFISTQHVRHRKINFEKSTFISVKDYFLGHPKVRPKAGDILLTLVGSIGFAAEVKKEHFPLSFTRHVGYVRLNQHKISNNFFIEYSESHIFKCFVDANVSQTAQPSIYLSSLSTHKLPVPPLSEQLSICEHLSRVTTPINNLIKNQNLEIKKLQEYKQTLIAHAVTGKIKVS